MTFCLNLNWTEHDGTEATVAAAYKQTVADILRQIRQELVKSPS